MRKIDGFMSFCLTLICILSGLVIFRQTKDFNAVKKLEVRLEKVEDKMDLFSSALAAELEAIKTAGDRQFKNTVKISENFFSLIEEEKKQQKQEFLAQSEKQQSEAEKFEKEGDELFSSKRFLDAFKKFCQVLTVTPENLQVREKKIKSLYLSNPMDSTNYSEILKDCSVLKACGYCSAEILNIEKRILQEKGLSFNAGGRKND